MISKPTRGLSLKGEADEGTRELLSGLHQTGFKTNDGAFGAGMMITAWLRGGGYYFSESSEMNLAPKTLTRFADVGASDMIAQGKIKLKHGSEIESFTKNGLCFRDGDEILADVIIFATGYASFSYNLSAKEHLND
jgi:hypothetical protein